jgi:TonB family protein
MNHFSRIVLCALSFGSALGGLERANAACDPQVVQRDTEFPTRAVARGQEGTVFMDVVVDGSGRAFSADVVDSSGYRLLDRAAEQSALTQWRFDVSSCERKDLPVKHRIAVEYRNDQ